MDDQSTLSSSELAVRDERRLSDLHQGCMAHVTRPFARLLCNVSDAMVLVAIRPLAIGLRKTIAVLIDREMAHVVGEIQERDGALLLLLIRFGAKLALFPDLAWRL
jgi:hypothetical protein